MFYPNPHSGPTFSGLRVGILGGSFNPAHDGHRAISLHALKQLKLDQVWWLVSPQNPLKPLRGMGTLNQRLEKARAQARSSRIIVTDLEAQFGTRYTIDTVRVLRRRFSHTQFVWLMGADNLKQISQWHQWPEIFRLVPIAVFRRPAYAVGRQSGRAAHRFSFARQPTKHAKSLVGMKPPAWLILDNKLNHLSATQIRQQKD